MVQNDAILPTINRHPNQRHGAISQVLHRNTWNESHDAHQSPETQGELAILKSEDSAHWLEVNHYEGEDYLAGSELDHIAFQVDDLEHALQELRMKGTQAKSYVRETQRSRWTYIADPDGIWIEIFQTKS